MTNHTALHVRKDQLSPVCNCHAVLESAQVLLVHGVDPVIDDSENHRCVRPDITVDGPPSRDLPTLRSIMSVTNDLLK